MIIWVHELAILLMGWNLSILKQYLVCLLVGQTTVASMIQSAFVLLSQHMVSNGCFHIFVCVYIQILCELDYICHFRIKVLGPGVQIMFLANDGTGFWGGNHGSRSWGAKHGGTLSVKPQFRRSVWNRHWSAASCLCV